MNLLHKFSIKNRPFATAVFALLAGQMLAQSFPAANTLNLPNGKTIHIAYDVDVNGPIPQGACTISSQATVSGSNFSTVSTDDPDVAGANNPTATPTADAPDITACPSSTSKNTDPNVCTASHTFAATAIACPATTTYTYKIGVATIASPHDFPVGVSMVTVTASNGVAPDATCSFDVTVSDAQAPTISCPSNTTVAADGSCAGTVGTRALASKSDNCTASGSINESQSPAASTVLSGHNDFETVVLTATDGNGNTSSCSFTVTLKDVSAPALTCPSSQNLTANPATCTQDYTIADPVSDNCSATWGYSTSGATTTSASGIADGTGSGAVAFAIGASTVVLSASDAAGNNAATCSFTVTVNAPEINVKGNGTTIADGDDMPSLSDDTDFGQSNGSSPVTKTYTIENLGTSLLTLGSNAVSIMGSSDFTVTLQPATSVAVGTNTTTFTVSFTPSSVGIKTATVNIANDDCTNNPYNFDITGEGTCLAASFSACPSTTVQVGTTDGNCSGTATYTVTATGQPEPTLTYVFMGATNSSGSGTGSGSTFGIGSTTVTVTATNPCSAPTCQFTVTVSDDDAPTVSCPSGQSVNTTTGSCTGTYTIADPVSDNCTGATWGAAFSGNTNGNPTDLSNIADGTGSGPVIFEKGTTTVTLSASDAAGNTATTCSFTVTVSDNEAPIVVCPSSQSLNTTMGSCTGTYTIADPVSDNCTGATWGAAFSGNANGNPTDLSGIADGTGSGSVVFEKGETTVTLSASDAAGNTATTCSFTVTVSDNEAPDITCPMPVVVGTSGGLCSSTATWSTPTPTDNCPGASIQSVSHTSSSTFAKGTTTVTYTAVDAVGNTETCTFTVTVNDDDPPTADCKNFVVALDASHTATIVVNNVNNASSDNCTAGANLIFNVTPSTLDCDDAGDVLVTLAVTDEAMNVGTCSATITVLDVLNYSQTAQRMAADGAANDQLGWGLALDGQTAMAGAPNDKVGTQSKQGSAYIFQQNEGGTDNWGQLKQIKATDGAAVDYFGNAISLDGSTALLAAHGDNVGTVTDAGAVYIFEQNHLGPNFWGQKAQIFARDGATDDWAAYDYFGGAVSLKNGRAIVGASKKKVGTKNAQGAAYIFEQNTGGPDNWGNVKKLTASDGAANNFFGQSVAQAGNLVLVGANGHNSNRGAAYFFDGTAAWAQGQKLVASDAAVGDGFGASVSLTNDYALVGAPNKAAYAGAAYVFKNNAGTWAQLKKLTASDGAANDRFGSAVAMMDDYAYVSAVRGNANAGAVYVFHKNMNGPDEWGQIGRYTASDGEPGDQFGYSLAVSSNKMFIGANLNDVAAKLDQGSAYLFTGEDCSVVRPLVSQAQVVDNQPKVVCYPNPFRDELVVEIQAEGAAHLQLTDAAGRVVTDVDLPRGMVRFELDSRRFPSGMYFVQVSTEGGVRVAPVALVR
ncbi:MAG: HYR domain-containing protein [Saprospiraceae bacterium]